MKIFPLSPTLTQDLRDHYSANFMPKSQMLPKLFGTYAVSQATAQDACPGLAPARLAHGSELPWSLGTMASRQPGHPAEFPFPLLSCSAALLPPIVTLSEVGWWYRRFECTISGSTNLNTRILKYSMVFVSIKITVDLIVFHISYPTMQVFQEYWWHASSEGEKWISIAYILKST